MEKAYQQEGFDTTFAGFLGGSTIYITSNWILSNKGAKHRKRSGQQQPSESENCGSRIAIALGTLLDGIPESIASGLSLLAGEVVISITVATIFLSNLPEGLFSAAGIKKRGEDQYIFLVYGEASLDILTATTPFTARIILAMLTNTMIPDAFKQAHNFTEIFAV